MQGYYINMITIVNAFFDNDRCYKKGVGRIIQNSNFTGSCY